jgi:hypothetical protein
MVHQIWLTHNILLLQLLLQIQKAHTLLFIKVSA